VITCNCAFGYACTCVHTDTRVITCNCAFGYACTCVYTDIPCDHMQSYICTLRYACTCEPTDPHVITCNSTFVHWAMHAHAYTQTFHVITCNRTFVHWAMHAHAYTQTLITIVITCNRAFGYACAVPEWATYTHRYTHTSIHKHTHQYTYSNTQRNTHAQTSTHFNSRQTNVLRIYTHIHTHTCNQHTHTRTHTHTSTPTHPPTHTHTHTHTHAHTHTHTLTCCMHHPHSATHRGVRACDVCILCVSGGKSLCHCVVSGGGGAHIPGMCVHVCVFACVCACMCACVCVCVCACVLTFVPCTMFPTMAKTLLTLFFNNNPCFYHNMVSSGHLWCAQKVCSGVGALRLAGYYAALLNTHTHRHSHIHTHTDTHTQTHTHIHTHVHTLLKVAMTGESNNIRYSVEPQFLDLGQQQYDKQLETELTISNQGKVPFNYAINTRLLSRPSVISVSA